MAETIKLQPEELQQLQNIQSRYQDKVFQFGQFYLERLSLDEKIKQLADAENNAKVEFQKIQQEEQQWMNSISTKYGDGNLSLRDGTFTPVTKQ
jgi:hypothetical protein